MGTPADRDVGGRSLAVIRVARRPAAPTSSIALSEQVRQAVQTTRAGGASALWWSGLAVAGWRRLVVYRLDRDIVLKRLEPRPGISLRPLTGVEIDAYRSLRPDAPDAEVRRRLQAGNVCMAAWRGDRMIAVRWLALERAEMPYLGVAFELAPGIGYNFDGFTDPHDRRTGVGAFASAALTDHAASLGVSTLINAVLPENALGRALTRGRSHPVGVVGVLRLGRWRIVRLAVPAGCFRAVTDTSVGV